MVPGIPYQTLCSEAPAGAGKAQQRQRIISVKAADTTSIRAAAQSASTSINSCSGPKYTTLRTHVFLGGKVEICEACIIYLECLKQAGHITRVSQVRGVLLWLLQLLFRTLRSVICPHRFSLFCCACEQKTKICASAVSSTDRLVLNFVTCVTTVRALSVISPRLCSCCAGREK